MANEKFRNALELKPQACPPIWMMRQAGRYHSHYQNLRKQHSFMDLCKNPQLASEVALGPIEDFDFDVSIFFSDLLFPLEALGMGLEYTDSGPQLAFQLTDETINQLKDPNTTIKSLEFQKEALLLTRKKLPSHKSLIGFVGAPWTLFAYATQGKHAGTLIQAKDHFHLFPRFCETLIPLLEKNIQLQIDGGAEIVFLFDTAVGEVSPWIYSDLIVPELKKLTNKFPHKLAYYSKHTTPDFFKNDLFKSKTTFCGMGVDHRWNMALTLRDRPLAQGFLQGNFDESLLCLNENKFESLFKKYLEPLQKLSLEQRTGWICGLGHGMLPQAKEQNVKKFVQLVRESFA